MDLYKILKIQMELRNKGINIPLSGKMDEATENAILQSKQAALAQDKDIKQMTMSDPAAISNAYLTGDWSGVFTPTGTPFTKEMQQEAFTEAEKALAPGFKAQQSYETADVEDTLANQQRQYSDFIKSEGEDFTQSKQGLDQNAADKGILFSGARYQKENDLRNQFEDRQNRAQYQTGRNIANTARDFQYRYGNQNAQKISDMYKLPGGNTYNANVSQNMVKPSMNMSNAYDPERFKFQGTTLNTQKAQTQTRAAGLLANRANKLLGQY